MMHRLLRLGLGVAVGMTATLARPAQVSEEASLKAAFIYRFAQFTQWPVPMKDFTYCTAGAQDLSDALRLLVARQHEFSQVRTVSLQQASAGSGCHLLVLSQMDRQEMLRWQQALSDAPVLVVADAPEALRSGAVIALTQEPNGLSFRINNTEAKRRGLVLSSQVLKLAREVR